jgi:5,10-methylenetetrahydromethanopterin reductase
MRLAVGAMHLFTRVLDAVAFARQADDVGIDSIGLGDSPFLYADLYTTMTAVLGATSHIRVAPCATNTVSRHWSVHAASFRAFSELAPRRGWLTLATGNSAVRMAGLAPQTTAALEDAVRRIRQAGPPDLEIFVAAAGHRTARSAGRVADGVLLGAGLDQQVVAGMVEAAEQGRAEAGRTGPFSRWLHTPFNLGGPEATDEILNAVIGFSRQALAFTFTGKNVPEDLRAPLRTFFDGYDFASHGKGGAGQSNAALLAARDDGEELKAFLTSRYALIGDAPDCARRLHELRASCGLDGVFLSIPVVDPRRLLTRIGSELLPLLG